MKILVIIPGSSGVEYHRLVSPCLHMQAMTDKFEFHFAQGIKLADVPEVAKSFKAVLFSRILVSDSPELCCRALKSHGVKLICDIDDYWILPKGHLLSNHFKKIGATEKTIACMRLADLVTTTTEHLASKISLTNGKIYILPNAINEMDPQWTLHEVSSDVVRIGWMGSTAHQEDVELLEQGIKKLRADKSLKFKIILFGRDQRFEKIWDRYEEILQPGESINWMEPTCYASQYNRIDISLIPLVNSEFNRCKSELKLIEAGWFSKACVVSEVKPYTNIATDENCLFARNDWYKQVKRLIQEPELRKRLGQQLHEDTRPFTMSNINKIRKEAFETVFKSNLIIV